MNAEDTTAPDDSTDSSDEGLSKVYDQFYIEDESKPVSKDDGVKNASPQTKDDPDGGKEVEAPEAREDDTGGKDDKKATVPGGDAVSRVLEGYKEYFDGTKGNYAPDQAVNYLFAMQRSMDENPLSTLLDIAQRYGIEEDVKKHYAASAGQQAPAPAAENGTEPGEVDVVSMLLEKIASLEQAVSGVSDPRVLDTHIVGKIEEQKKLNDAMNVVSEVSKDLPLYGEIAEDDLSYFIQKSWGKLGESASMHDVLKHAYDMAINADPELRKKAAALGAKNSQDDIARVAAAKNAAAANVVSSGDARSGGNLSPEEELSFLYDKLTR